jgi:hypothetical protein
MANTTFEKILVKDDRIACITGTVKYAVERGGQNVTSQPFKAISQTTSSHVYNVTVPSLETIISREVLWQSTVTLKIAAQTGSIKPTGKYLVNYGVTDALAPFPLHHFVTQMTTTINNNTVSMNVQDTLRLILRLLDPEEMSKYECMTPTTLDYLANYSDAVQPMPYQLALRSDDGTNANPRPVVYRVASDTQETNPPNWTVDTPGVFAGTRTQTFLSSNDNVLSYEYNRIAGSSYYHKPRGTWKLQALWVADPSATATGGKRKPRPSDTTVYVTFKVTEPLLISPFVFGAPEGKQGFYGIQTMSFQMNIAPTANRAWRCSNTGSLGSPFIKVATIVNFTDSQLIFTFLTPHATDLLEPRNVVPFYELPIYRTSNLVNLPAANTAMNDDGAFTEAQTVTLYSSSVQLYSIPDKLIICVRKPPAALTHGSTGQPDYQRLEFLGDRILGLIIADMLYHRYKDEAEGRLSHRLNALVSGVTCADIARQIGLPPFVRLGKQARDDGAQQSDNVLGDVMEAIIGALYLEYGLLDTRDLVERLWRPLLESANVAPKHPKTELQEWCAAHGRKVPDYVITK